MKKLRFMVSVAVALGGLALTMAPVSAKPEYTKKEKTGCATCHVTAKSKDLNDTGKCYHDKKSMAECKK